jgi:hypothetical protein
MTHAEQFSSVQEERWSEISEFPGYFVSDQGRVQNTKFVGRLVKASVGTHGALMVGLMRERVQHKRSLALLVATAFVPQPEPEVYDTPIHRNGDRTDVHYENLMWRPLWFARRFMRQFTDGHSTLACPVEDINTGETYETSMDASMVLGALDADIVYGIHNNVYVWPTHHHFRKVE